MLDAYIIEAIRREEERRRQAAEASRRLWIEAPLPPPPRARIEEPEAEHDPIVIPLRHGEGPDEDDAAA